MPFSNKKNRIAGDFHQRLQEVLDTKKQIWWRKKLNVSSSVIGFRWKNGGIPKADKIIEICKLSGVSANWLLLGTGPKYIDPSPDPEEEKHLRNANKYIQELEDKIEIYKNYLSDLPKKEHTLNALIKMGKLVNLASSESLDNIPEEEIFETYVLPFFIYFRSFSDIAVRIMETFINSESNRKFLYETLHFLKNEQEKNEFLYKGRNKELDTLFDSQYFSELLNK